MTKKKLLKQLSISSMVLVAALAVTNQSSSIVRAQEEATTVLVPEATNPEEAASPEEAAGSEETNQEVSSEEAVAPETESPDPKKDEPLELYRQRLQGLL